MHQENRRRTAQAERIAALNAKLLQANGHRIAQAERNAALEEEVHHLRRQLEISNRSRLLLGKRIVDFIEALNIEDRQDDANVQLGGGELNNIEDREGVANVQPGGGEPDNIEDRGGVANLQPDGGELDNIEGGEAP